LKRGTSGNGVHSSSSDVHGAPIVDILDLENSAGRDAVILRADLIYLYRSNSEIKSMVDRLQSAHSSKHED